MKPAALLVLAFVATAGCDRKIAGGRADGKAIFDEACARCHGPDGIPTKSDAARLGVKNLTEPELHDRLSDSDMYGQILHGSKNQRMPSFQGALSEDQVLAVIVHVRTLRRPSK